MHRKNINMNFDKLFDEVLPGFYNLLKKVKNKTVTLKEIGINCNCDSYQSGNDCSHYRDFERFPWRFRIAQHKISFITFNDKIKCVESTRKAYEELSRFSMVWSAYEIYTRLFNLKPWDFFKELNDINVKIICNKIRKIDSEMKFTQFLIKHSYGENAEKNLKSFIGGDNSMLLFFAKEVRNMYVHGNLTANPAGLKSLQFANFLSDLSEFFIIEIKEHFRQISYKF